MKWQQALKDYQSYLRIERGLSENSISNYALDINKLITWLDESSIQTTAIEIKPEVLQEFIYSIAKDINPRSQSRIISGLKGFFNYLIFENYRKITELGNSDRTTKLIPNRSEKCYEMGSHTLKIHFADFILDGFDPKITISTSICVRNIASGK